MVHFTGPQCEIMGKSTDSCALGASPLLEEMLLLTSDFIVTRKQAWSRYVRRVGIDAGVRLPSGCLLFRRNKGPSLSLCTGVLTVVSVRAVLLQVD